MPLEGINPIEAYKDRAMIHEGYRYLYSCLVHKPRRYELTGQYEKWHCDHVKTGCKAYVINESWEQDEERVAAHLMHNHPIMEDWSGFYGFIYPFTEEKPYPEMVPKGLTPPRKALGYLDKPL